MSQPQPPSAELSPVISLERVSRLYGSFIALRDISLKLPAGSSVVLLGPNGAGKSTLLKLLAGLAQASYGTVHVFGKPPDASRGRIAYMSHHTTLYDELTGPENLRYLLGLQRPSLSPAQQADHVGEALRQVGLDPANPRRVGEYSQGMRQRASLARVLLADPDLLLLDEPFSNLDTSSADAMVSRLQRFLAAPSAAGQPRSLLLTTHQAQLAEPLARQTLFLQNGSFSPGPRPTGLPPHAALTAVAATATT